MSTGSGLQAVLRRRSVGARAQVAVDASMAAMAIRALARRPEASLGVRPERALRSMLNMLDEIARYKEEDLLGRFVSEDHVTSEKFESVQALAHAAHKESTNAKKQSFPALDSLIETRHSLLIDTRTEEIRVSDADNAKSLADVLDALASDLLSDATSEDRTRVSRYALA